MILRCVVLLLCFFVTSVRAGASVDVVIMSYDRPMQLYSCLESIYKYVSNYNEIHVIYRTSAAPFDQGYDIVKKSFPHAHFYKQEMSPVNTFRELFLATSFPVTSQAGYIMYAVDDDMAVDYIDLSACVEQLQRNKQLWGFFLRLGKNINHSYTLNIPVKVPKGQIVATTYFLWDFQKKQTPWGYSTTVDMTIYRKQDIEPQLRSIAFTSPNTLERRWWVTWNKKNINKKGISFLRSKIVNLPINIVQENFSNRREDLFTKEKLLSKFLSGYKIDISPFFRMKNNAPHMGCKPTFIVQNPSRGA